MTLSLPTRTVNAMPVRRGAANHPAMAPRLAATSSGKEGSMLAVQQSMRDPESIKMAFLLITVLGITFWRIMVKLLAIAAVVLIIWGAFALLQAIH